jgi:hypothetical protein
MRMQKLALKNVINLNPVISMASEGGCRDGMAGFRKSAATGHHASDDFWNESS